MFKNMRLVILFDMLLNPSFKMTADFANIARTTASTNKFNTRKISNHKDLSFSMKRKVWFWMNSSCIVRFVISLKCKILIIDTWNEYMKNSHGMVNLFFFIINLILGCLLFKKAKKFNESCSLSKTGRMLSTYFK